VELEANAILSIIKMCDGKEYELIGSGVIEIEISKTADTIKRDNAYGLYELHSKYIGLNDTIYEKAKDLAGLEFGNYDALHIATAEFAEADVFITTDDELIKLAKANKNKIKIKVENPANWIMEG
jgi:predicted nucleic acid-binding protein